ncbi:hypothetical protein L3X38_030535 [Prunus dulcis]|uniref:SWIM-type domain-containing protein n=1 Tax=Prunus dulcis TaxID=3755 RepID=A0AAD4VAE4_PRUDU|nr:hypothetical protein L3X38_030535 [Prunus dulcis]
MVKCAFQQHLGQPKFQRLYVYLGAAKECFKAGCRPIIGLDGCFLKSVYARQLLIDVDIDTNNETWVIAYAVVESECKESWIWFLELLVKDCQIVNQFGFTFISDKQKGLLLAFEQVVPNCDHRFYARHLFSNYMVFFKAKNLKDKFWEASYATTVPHFTRAMEDLKKLSKDAYEWLTTLDKPQGHWSKSHFNTHLKCDMLLNNLCESFNATILECRDRPILSMFEYIRCGGKFQVSAGGHAQYIVNLELRTCSCRAWDLQGWPCIHAIAAINYKGGLNVMDFVDDCYLTTTYLKTYENLILPMNGMDMWDKSDFLPCLPSYYSKQPGRPRKCRNKEEGEHKGKMKIRASSNKVETVLSRIPNTQDSLKCGQCGKRGTIKRLAIGIFPQKPNLQLRGRWTIIDPSDASTLAGGPGTLKQRSKPPRRVQERKPLPKPSKKGHATYEAQPASTSCPHASTSISTVGSNVVD